MMRTGKTSMLDAQYHAGLLLKINLKLGGANVYAPEPGLSLVRTKPTIVFGVDVNHSAPNSQKALVLCASRDDG